MVKTENIFEFLVMYHPKEEYEISYEDTTEIDFNKPKTAEEVGRKLLKLNQLDNVEIENHYHTRTFPAPDGSDVNTVSFNPFTYIRVVGDPNSFSGNFTWKILFISIIIPVYP